jgi:hypothetical protein
MDYLGLALEDLIEKQLAHAEPNATRDAYNCAEHLPERRALMQRWADYLDKLKKSNKPKGQSTSRYARY